MRNDSTLLALAGQRQKSLAAQLKAGAAEPLDLLAAEVESDTLQLTQIEDEAQLQAALGALEDAVQRPSDDFAALQFLPAHFQP